MTAASTDDPTSCSKCVCAIVLVCALVYITPCPCCVTGFVKFVPGHTQSRLQKVKLDELVCGELDFKRSHCAWLPGSEKVTLREISIDNPPSGDMIFENENQIHMHEKQTREQHKKHNHLQYPVRRARKGSALPRWTGIRPVNYDLFGRSTHHSASAISTQTVLLIDNNSKENLCGRFGSIQFCLVKTEVLQSSRCEKSRSEMQYHNDCTLCFVLSEKEES